MRTTVGMNFGIFSAKDEPTHVGQTDNRWHSWMFTILITGWNIRFIPACHVVMFFDQRLINQGRLPRKWINPSISTRGDQLEVARGDEFVQINHPISTR